MSKLRLKFFESWTLDLNRSKESFKHLIVLRKVTRTTYEVLNKKNGVLTYVSIK